MVPEFTHAEIIECLSNPRYQERGVGLLIIGSSRDERSTMAETVLRQRREAGHCCLSLTPFEVVAAYHFGQSDRLRREDVLLIKDLGELSQAERDAIDVIKPILPVTAILVDVLESRWGWDRTTLVTTEYEIPKLETQFSPKLASLAGNVGFSIRLDGKDGERHADRP
jgi:hypothetical protein